jgi:hypothetical protein
MRAVWSQPFQRPVSRCCPGKERCFFYSINGRWFYQQREKTRSQVTRNRVAGSRTLKKATLSTLSNSRFWFSVVRASVETHV